MTGVKDERQKGQRGQRDEVVDMTLGSCLPFLGVPLTGLLKPSLICSKSSITELNPTSRKITVNTHPLLLQPYAHPHFKSLFPALLTTPSVNCYTHGLLQPPGSGLLFTPALPELWNLAFHFPSISRASTPSPGETHWCLDPHHGYHLLQRVLSIHLLQKSCSAPLCFHYLKPPSNHPQLSAVIS